MSIFRIHKLFEFFTFSFGGGGDGGDGGAAARKAAEDARIAAAIQRINEAFGTSGNAAAGREATYSKIGEDTKANALIDLNKDRSITERDLGFMLARQGLSGGSRDVDVNRDVLDKFQQGVLKATNMGLSSANNARSADDQTRVKLIQSVQAGLDEGSAIQQAYEGMRNNSRAAQDDANTASLAGFFDTLVNQQKNAAYSDAFSQTVNPYRTQGSSATSSPTARYGGTTNSIK
jgi:hypothetical protein